jgi:tRNA dimethylallyltransferase
MSNKGKIVVITGPTAVGKSALAVELALRMEGEIVNADSMQVYRGMDIGTAKPSVEQRGRVPHHLLDVVNPDDAFNAAIYRSLALPVIEEILRRGHVPFVVGGTGLYIKTLLGGLLHCPASDPGLRERLNRQCDQQGLESLYSRLRALDPDSAQKIHPHDKVRILRALEITELTQTPYSVLAREHRFRERPFQALKICLQMNRQDLYDRINRRSERIFQKGLVAETEALLSQGYAPDLKPMKSLGYRHAVKVLQGDWDVDQAVRQLQTDTRRYAKRQLTWFRADAQCVWHEPEEKHRILEDMRRFFLDSGNNRESDI